MTESEFVGAYTDWSRYDLPTLASFLDEDLSAAWSQVRTWGQTYDLVSRHVEVLRRTRSALAAAWPPERSPAAQTFFSVLDELIASMDEMQGMAVTNGASLHGILTSLSGTKRTVDGLHEQWQATDAVEAAKGEYYDASWQDDLNQQARAQMRTNDEAVIEYYPYLSVPTPYHPPAGPRNEVETPLAGPDGSNPAGGRSASRPGLRPPTIPPVPPFVPPGPSDKGPTLSAVPRGSATAPIHGAVQPPPVLPSEGKASSGWGLPASPNGSWFVVTPSGRALRPGGVIGPSAVEPAPVIDPQAARQGGVDAVSGSGDIGREVGPVGGLLGGPIGGGTHGDRPTRVRRLPPDTEWEVRSGVPPVLLPPAEPTKHDPGPGVIGIDR